MALSLVTKSFDSQLRRIASRGIATVSAKSWWLPDPATGFYVPEGKEVENLADHAKLREEKCVKVYCGAGEKQRVEEVPDRPLAESQAPMK